MRAAFTGILLCAGCLALPQTANLKLKFPAGRTDRVTSTVNMVQTFSTPGTTKPMKMVMDQSSAMLMKVLGSNAQGANLRLTYESVKTVMNMNGTKMDQGAEIAKVVKGKSVSLNFSPDGKLKKVSGFKEIIDATTDAQSKAMMQQMFSEDAIRQMWTMSYGGMVPGKAVKVGETWNSTMAVGQAPMKMSLKLKMKLNKVVGNVAYVGMTGTGSMDMSGMTGANMSFKTKALNVTGSMMFDTARGWLKEQTMAMTMSGALVVNSQGKKQETPITSKMTSTTKVKPVS